MDLFCTFPPLFYHVQTFKYCCFLHPILNVSIKCPDKKTLVLSWPFMDLNFESRKVFLDFSIFFLSFFCMLLRFFRPLIQPRIHLLRAWASHITLGTSSSRPLIFENIGNNRQNWRFFYDKAAGTDYKTKPQFSMVFHRFLMKND